MGQRTSRIVTALSLTVAVIAVGMWGIGALNRQFTEQFTILKAKRPYTSTGPFITEAEALVIARQAMDAAGYSSDQWLPLTDGRTKAPDGRPDEYFARNTMQNGGTFMFHNENREDWYRDLHVGLHQNGDVLEVYVSRGK